MQPPPPQPYTFQMYRIGIVKIIRIDNVFENIPPWPVLSKMSFQEIQKHLYSLLCC